LKFGLKESVINVAAVNADEFRFSAWDHYRFVDIITLHFEDANNTYNIHHSEQILPLY
jgi:hypothetical protein